MNNNVEVFYYLCNAYKPLKMTLPDYPIDVVVAWVDSSDPKWQEEKARYLVESPTCDASEARYKDWGTFIYWFRGIEKFMPWVNKVFVITNGTYPEWLNTAHPKIVMVDHKDYIPEDCLPTFCSRAIEVGMHRIKGLSEHFIYFNDDMFVTAPCQPSDFFRNGLPCDNPTFSANYSYGMHYYLSVYMSVGPINRNFSKHRVLRSGWRKWFHPCIGLAGLYKAITRIPNPSFDGFKMTHYCQPYLKSTFEHIWEKEGEELSKVQHNRFRQYTDLTIWAVRYWQLAENNFAPHSLKDRRLCTMRDEEIGEICSLLPLKKYKVICINDSEYSHVTDFDKCKNQLHAAFTQLFPSKSSFEL